MSLPLINDIVGKQCFQLCLSVYRGFPILNCSNFVTSGTAPNPGPLPSPYRVPTPLSHTHVQTLLESRHTGTAYLLPNSPQVWLESRQPKDFLVGNYLVTAIKRAKSCRTKCDRLYLEVAPFAQRRQIIHSQLENASITKNIIIT